MLPLYSTQPQTVTLTVDEWRLVAMRAAVYVSTDVADTITRYISAWRQSGALPSTAFSLTLHPTVAVYATKYAC